MSGREPRVRFMRLLVFFDLPVLTTADRREYRQFRKFLIDEGYLMMQESVYSKLVMNNNAAETALEKLRQHRPFDGLVQVLKITEKQFSTIEFISGHKIDNGVDDTLEDFVVI